MNKNFVKAFALEVLKVWLLLAALLCIGLTIAHFAFPTSPLTGFTVLPL